MKLESLKVALIQQSCEEDKNKNIKKTCELIKEAAISGAKLVALQELHTSLYFCQNEIIQNFDLADEIPNNTTNIFCNIAKELKIVLIISLFEKRTKGLYHNTALVIDSDGSIAGKYRKMHIPDDPAFYEKFYFTEGDLGFKPIKTSIGNLGVLVCWDQWFPEAARLMTLNNADILIYPTAIGWDPSDNDKEKERQKEAWITIQRSHAIANALPVLSINRVGFEGDIDFWGHSFACGCQGQIIKMADSKKEEILIADLDMTETEKIRRIWPFLRDRRIDNYKDLTKRFID